MTRQPDDRTVQVPVSLIESAADALTLVGDMAASNELLALLSQPTPTAEQECTCFPVPERLHTTHYGATDPATTLEPNPDCPLHFPTAEPPRIEDMAPGTTFTAVSLRGPERWTRQIDGVTDRHGNVWSIDELDPSTIRDVTPPKEA